MLAALVTAVTALPASAQWTMTGARTVPGDSAVFRIALGWPDSHLGWRFPVTETVDIGPRVGIQGRLGIYGAHDGFCCGAGNSLGLEVRGEVARFGQVALSVEGVAAGLANWQLFGEITGGVHVSLAALMDWVFAERFALTWGFGTPVEVYFTEPTGAIVPFLFQAGFDARIVTGVLLYAQGRAGPALDVSDLGTRSGIGAEIRVGVAMEL